LAAAKAEFDRMEAEGIVRRSSSAWSSPLHMVRKSDGGWRPCGDFRRLNLITTEDKYPVPNMDDLTARLNGCRIFSKLDLRKGYHQVPMRKDDIPKTAVITPFGLYEFLVMAFGLKNAGMTFQRMMDRVLQGLPFCFVYLDDILVASPDVESHQQHLREVLARLQEHGLVLNVQKCIFGAASVEFLGHTVSAKGVEPLHSRVAALTAFPPPTTIKELQGFLGMVNFYRRFIPAAARILLPLTEVLKGSPAGGTAVQWTAAMREAFQAAKDSLASATALAHPAPAAELVLVTDASGTHIGAALQQRRSAGGDWEPLGFYSKKLDAAQRVYSAFDRELFAVFSGIRHFRHALEGRSFAVWTDHKPLCQAITRSSDPWTPKQQRQLSYIAEYTNQLIHLPGKDNVVADTLSRPPAVSAAVAAVPPNPEAVDWAGLGAAQQTCEEVAAMLNSPSLTIRRTTIQGVDISCDYSTGAARPLLPPSFRKHVFHMVHNLSHPGIRATRRLLAARYLWPGMNAQVAAWCRDCQQCQRSKVTQQPAAPLQPIAVPSRRFAHVHIDLVGPLPTTSAGNNHILTMVDRATRWVEAVPMRSTTAADCAAAFTANWISRYGVPDQLTSDRGPQFTSGVWAATCHLLGLRHITTTAYHPQANGLVERFHRRLKEALRARSSDQQWDQHLPWVLLGIRSAPRDDDDISAAELVFGAPLSLPGDFVAAEERPAELFLRHLRLAASSTPTRPLLPSQEKRPLPATLLSASHVYVRRGNAAPPLAAVYQGPFRVVQPGEKFFVLEMGDKHETVSVDRLKPHLGTAPLVPALPARRGRPRSAAAGLAALRLEGGRVATEEPGS